MKHADAQAVLKNGTDCRLLGLVRYCIYSFIMIDWKIMND